MNNPIKTKILVWGSVLREKKGGRWVGGGGSVRTRDGPVEVGWGGRRMGQWREKREEEERSVKLPTPAEWLAWTTKGAMGRRLILGFTSGTLSFILGLGLAWMMRVSSSGLLFKFSLSLSLFGCVSLENDLKVNEICNPFYRSKDEFYGKSLIFSIWLYFTFAPKHASGCKIFSQFHLHPKQNIAKVSKRSYN